MNNSTLPAIPYVNPTTSLPSYGKIFLPRVSEVPVAFVLTYGVIGALVVLFNGLTLLIFIKKREIRKRKSNLFLLSLSAADFIVGVSSFIYLYCLRSNSLSVLSKRISTIVLGFSLEISMFSLCCITYERLVGVKNSLKYEKLVTSARVKTAIIFSWTISVAMTSCQGIISLQFEDGRYFELNGVVIVVLATTISVFLAVVYVYLYLEIRRHSRNIRNTSVSVTCSLDLDATRSLEDVLDVEKSNFDTTQESMMPQSKTQKVKGLLLSLSKEKRSLILCSFIVCSFMICWAPVTVFFAGLMLDVEYLNRDSILYISNCLILINSLLDPCIYFALRNDLRRAAFSVFCRSSQGQAR